VPEVQGIRAARFHKKTVDAFVDMVAAAGLRHPGELRPHHLMHRSGPEKAVSLDRIHTFLPERILLDAPEETIYADWWEAARIDSFKPATELSIRRATVESPRSPV
jgi:hypothetical protein